MRKSSQGSDDNQGMKDAGPTADPASIGALLRQARETAGLSLAAVSERTKIRPGILRDIEADNHAMLPALTYTLGFVKAFARTVGIDPQLAAERYRAESQKGEPVPTLVELEPLEARRLPSRGLVVMLTTGVALVLGFLTAWGAGWLSPPPPAPAALTDSAPSNGAADAEPSLLVQSRAEPEPPAADAPVRLAANTEVWLRITEGAAGEALFMGTLAKGQTLDLPPGKEWQLRTGRAGAIDVTVGGQPVPALGGPAEQVRGVVLTPDALLGRTTARAADPARATAAPAAVPGLPEARSLPAPATDSSAVNPAPAADSSAVNQATGMAPATAPQVQEQ